MRIPRSMEMAIGRSLVVLLGAITLHRVAQILGRTRVIAEFFVFQAERIAQERAIARRADELLKA